MKKHLLLLCSLFLMSVSHLKSQLTFTIVNTSGSNSITCAHPTVNLVCITNYTAGFVTYTLSGPGYTAIGYNQNISIPGTYTITAFSTNIINSTQTLVIGTNTTVPVSAISPTYQTISCNVNSIISVTATANPTLNATHLFTTPSGGSLAVNGTTAMYTPGAIGTYTHSLMDNVNGCKTTKTFIVTTFAGIPTATLSSPQNFSLGCGSNSVCNVSVLGQTTPTGGSITYTLLSASSSTNYVPNSQNVFSITAAGNYTTVVRDFTTSCETKIQFSVVQNTTSPNVSVFANTQTLSCFNNQASLLGLSTTQNVNYVWSYSNPTGSVSGNSFSVTTNANYTNTLLGDYTLTVIDNNNACTTNTTIQIYQNIFPPHAVITATGAAQITCLTTSVVLNNQSTTGIPVNSGFANNLPVAGFQWMGPAPQVSVANTSSYIASVAGIYTLVAKDQNNGCTSQTVFTVSDAKNFPVVNSPVAPPAYCLDPPTQSLDISPIVSGATANFTYFWIIPTTATISGQGTPTLNTNAVGVYSVLVTNTVSGCTTVGQLTVTVCTGLNYRNTNGFEIALYPNPASSYAELHSTNLTQDLRFELFNLSGQLVLQGEMTDTNNRIELKELPQGFYSIRLMVNEQMVYSGKLIKE